MKVSKKFLAIIMIFALIFPCASFETQAAKAVSVTLGVKENYKLSVKPAKNTNIGNDTVIALKSDKVTALKKGKSTLDYTDKNGKKYSFVFTVKSAPASISLPKKKTVFDTETISLKYTLSKGSAGKVTFSTSNPRVATVDKNGVVFAKHKGSVTISAKTYNGKKAKCKLTVKQGVRTMAMSKDRLTLGKTSSAKLSVQVNSGAVCDSYKWKTSNKKVVTVKGKGTKATVTAKKPGKAIVTCVADSGVKATCEVVVTKTTTSDSIKKQINAQPLYPQKTGYAPLDKLVEKKLKKILKGKKTNYDKLKAIYDYEIKNFSYGDGAIVFGEVFDLYTENDAVIIIEAYNMLETNVGVCNDYAAVFTVMARAVGFEAYSVSGQTAYVSGEWKGHEWNNILINNQYILFDAQVEDKIAGKGKVSYCRFAKTDKAVEKVYKYTDRKADIENFKDFYSTFDVDFVVNIKITRNGKTVSKELKWDANNCDYYGANNISISTGQDKGNITYTVTVKKGGGEYYLLGNEKYFNAESPYYVNSFYGVLEEKDEKSIAVYDSYTGIGFVFELS